jgi:hypothetical protein
MLRQILIGVSLSCFLRVRIERLGVSSVSMLDQAYPAPLFNAKPWQAI